MLYRPDPSQEQTERKFYIDVLKSDGCQCGRTMQPRRAFCFKCFFKLPPEILCTTASVKDSRKLMRTPASI